MDNQKPTLTPEAREYLSQLGRIRTPKKLAATRENMRKAREKRWPHRPQQPQNQPVTAAPTEIA
jgi:hypothetical protein